MKTQVYKNILLTIIAIFLILIFAQNEISGNGLFVGRKKSELDSNIPQSSLIAEQQREKLATDKLPLIVNCLKGHFGKGDKILSGPTFTLEKTNSIIFPYSSSVSIDVESTRAQSKDNENPSYGFEYILQLKFSKASNEWVVDTKKQRFVSFFKVNEFEIKKYSIPKNEWQSSSGEYICTPEDL
ncbi:hypothetical protein SAMN02949497_3217 [Methylomagnum ishizawai]|uniref:Uncharacterized protein n=1 Tax=Methylomagnum ishizawai TaxID=1760988 RepID=A0A1Y6D5L3_9GAMM|nr:hypothetical protein [Methylomagnum ishizawai]SMF95842.1 hypothetical protein SAMN02949497_3217 [Methylomagnum ishizawai]